MSRVCLTEERARKRGGDGKGKDLVFLNESSPPVQHLHVFVPLNIWVRHRREVKLTGVDYIPALPSMQLSLSCCYGMRGCSLKVCVCV